jgi:hypothetical protein
LFAALVAYGVEEAPEPDEYVVWVDQLNLRGEPSTKADVITVFQRDDKVTDFGEAVVYADGFWWRHVRAGESEGWVVDKYELLASVFDAFKEADARAKVGTAAEMLDSINEGCRVLAEARPRFPGSDKPYSVSPDGGKIFVAVECLYNWRSGYPGGPRGSFTTPVLYFEYGKGLVDCTIFEVYGVGKWYAGKRYYVYAGFAPEWEWELLAELRCMDTDTREEINLGYCWTSDEYYDFVGDYIIWLSEEKIPPGPERDLGYGDLEIKPVMMAYEFPSGKMFRILEADMSTLSPEPIGTAPCSGRQLYEVKLAPAADIPEAVRKSELYRKYNGGIAGVWSEGGA